MLRLIGLDGREARNIEILERLFVPAGHLVSVVKGLWQSLLVNTVSQWQQLSKTGEAPPCTNGSQTGCGLTSLHPFARSPHQLPVNKMSERPKLALAAQKQNVTAAPPVVQVPPGPFA